MKLFLDAHISARAVASSLRKRGYDVRAADEERTLDGWDDPDLLDLATSEGRIFVTFNVRDFPRIVREWASVGRSHAGCIVFVGMDQSEFGLIIKSLERECKLLPRQGDWTNRLLFISRK